MDNWWARAWSQAWCSQWWSPHTPSPGGSSRTQPSDSSVAWPTNHPVGPHWSSLKQLVPAHKKWIYTISILIKNKTYTRVVARVTNFEILLSHFELWNWLHWLLYLSSNGISRSNEKVNLTCPWPKEMELNLFPENPLSSANFRRAMVGSAPGERIKIRGAQQLESW